MGIKRAGLGAGITTITSVFTAVSASDGAARTGDGRSYFVDATNGSDSRDGQSVETAWQTIAKVNGISFNPGDTILFKRGETWREMLLPKLDGGALLPITFGAYGKVTDPFPLIDGRNSIKALAWTAPSGGATISAITKANPAAVTTSTAHGIVTGQMVYLAGSNMTEVNGNTYKVTVSDSTHFTLATTAGVAVDSSAYTNVGNSGTAQLAIWSAKVPTLAAYTVKGNRIPYRTAWPSPTGGGFATDDLDLFREVTSIQFSAIAGATITSITKASTAVVTTSPAHGFSTGHLVTISGSNMTEVNGVTFKITVTDSTHFSLADTSGVAINSTGYTNVGNSGTAASGVCTATFLSHDLRSGDGPFFDETTGALPIGLADRTPYWIAKIDENTFYQCSSEDNARAYPNPTRIASTTAGTGTHTLVKPDSANIHLKFNNMALTLAGMGASETSAPAPNASLRKWRIDGGGTVSGTGLGYNRFLDYGSLTGTYTVGETVTGGTSGATATVVADTGSQLQLLPVSGEFVSGETATGGTSAAHATTSGTYYVQLYLYRTGGNPSTDTNLARLLIDARPSCVAIDRSYIWLRDLRLFGSTKPLWIGSQESSPVITGLWIDNVEVAYSNVNGVEVHYTTSSLFTSSEWHHNGYTTDGQAQGQDSNSGSNLSIRDGSVCIYSFIRSHDAGEDGVQVFRTAGSGNEFHSYRSYWNMENAVDCKNGVQNFFDCYFQHFDNVVVTNQWPVSAGGTTVRTRVNAYRCTIEQGSQGIGAGNCMRTAELSEGTFLYDCRVIHRGAGSGASAMVAVSGTTDVAFGDADRFAFKAWNTEFIAMDYNGSGAGVTMFNISSQSTKTITGISVTGGVATVTANAHGYNNGIDVWIFLVVGTTQINGLKVRVANKTTNTFDAYDPLTGLPLNAAGWSAYTSGGTIVKDTEAMNIGLYGCTFIGNQKRGMVIGGTNWAGKLEAIDTIFAHRGASTTAADGQALQIANAAACSRISLNHNNYRRTNGTQLMALLGVGYVAADIGVTVVAGVNGVVGGAASLSVDSGFTSTSTPLDLRPASAAVLPGITRSDLPKDRTGRTRAATPTMGAHEALAA